MRNSALSVLGILMVMLSQSQDADAAFDPLNELSSYNVVWNSPSADARGSMPIGNGDIGVNAWVEPTGDLLLLVGKTDTWDENMRLLKLGKLRVKFTPSLVQPGRAFSQTLDLAGGRIVIKTDAAEVVLWVDAGHPLVQIDARSLTGAPISASASVEVWRQSKREFGKDIGYPAFPQQPAYSWPDTVLPAANNQIGWFHRNVASCWRDNLKLQKLEALAHSESNPLLNRTMGAVLRGDHWVSASPTELKTEQRDATLSLRLHALTEITATSEDWLASLTKQTDTVEAMDVASRRKAHARWWSDFWQRSWIFVAGDTRAEDVTRGYTLQRFLNACGGRGAYPIKFNGSIFVVEGADGHKFDADYRLWGGGYWFQNTRLTYWSMLLAGDFDLMRPFFDLHVKNLPIRKLATQNYYGHSGAFFPETMTFWGTYLDENYGTTRAGKPDGLTENAYIRRYWSGGLEMVTMMLDYHDLTQDNKFRDATLIPYAREITTFFDQHWKRGADGKIHFAPAQALETWHTAVNPTPEIAGLRYILPRLQTKTTNAELKAGWQKTLNDLPPVPLGTDAKSHQTVILPAEQFSDNKNSENPELYAVFPYRLYTLAAGSEALDIANNTWRVRRHPENRGWQQNSIQAALLGHADEARNYIADSVTIVAPGFRFPAVWGPNYDWMPDQDHGSVVMSALQRMLLQYEDRKIILLPAWPADWSADFKLHAPNQTTVEGSVLAGKLVNLKVLPASRRQDVVFGTNTSWVFPMNSRR